MSEPTVFDHPGGGIRVLRIERDGHFVSVKRQIGDTDEYERHLMLDPASALGFMMELCVALVEIRGVEDADRHDRTVPDPKSQ